MKTERWVWLEVAALPPKKRPRVNPSINRHYVPEAIIYHIPSYRAQLAEKLVSINSHDDDDEPVIRDDQPRDPQIVTKAIRFLVSGHLTPLDASTNDCEKTLDTLVELWYFSSTLTIVSLSQALISHIENSTAVTLEIFLAFARRFYARFTDVYKTVERTSLGQMIKRKLAYFLPLLQESMTVDEISSEVGVLGKQLIAVLLEDRATKYEKSDPKAKIDVKAEIS
jgi:hypothetical protein